MTPARAGPETHRSRAAAMRKLAAAL